MRTARREKVFGPGRAVPLDRNAKARILAYAKAWRARHAQPGRALLPVLRGDRRQGGVRAQHGR